MLFLYAWDETYVSHFFIARSVHELSHDQAWCSLDKQYTKNLSGTFMIEPAHVVSSAYVYDNK